MSGKKWSGQFRLRISPLVHEKLATEAADLGLSLNAYLASIIGERQRPSSSESRAAKVMASFDLADLESHHDPLSEGGAP